MRVVERCHHLRLTLEEIRILLTISLLGRQHLDCYVTLETRVFSEPDLTHTATSDLFEQAIATKLLFIVLSCIFLYHIHLLHNLCIIFNLPDEDSLVTGRA